MHASGRGFPSLVPDEIEHTEVLQISDLARQLHQIVSPQGEDLQVREDPQLGGQGKETVLVDNQSLEMLQSADTRRYLL